MNPSGDRPRISLLHATYRRAGGPLEVRDAWLSRAVNPEAVEYLLSMDADDATSVALTEGLPRVVNPAWPGVVTAVRNWNAAAAAARGDLLVVVADDLFPPPGWDQTLLGMVDGFDARRLPFAVKVCDDPRPADVLVRHPVVSRAFYDRFGLFSPVYRGVYCDDDFTTRAFWRATILDGRSLRLEHCRPRGNRPSDSRARMNRREEYLYGQELYRGAWPWWKRKPRPRLLALSAARRASDPTLGRTQRKLRALSCVDYLVCLPLRTSQALWRRASGRRHAAGPAAV